MRTTGVIARGILTPILKQGDDLVQIVTDCLMRSAQCDGYSLQDGDIIGVTEAVVGRTQGNYATCEQIAQALQAQFKPGPLGLVFPILSRNRFSILLKAMAIAAERLFILLSYPADEVGNELVPHEAVAQKGVNPYSGCLTEPEFRGLFGWDYVHPFTGVDYIQLYKEFGPHIEILFSNDPLSILTYTRQVLCCDIHTRERTRAMIQAAAPDARVLTMQDILREPVGGSGWSEYGLLGSNKATEDKVKLFPRDTHHIVTAIQQEMLKRTGKLMEVLVYGDGCFKDPVGGIWELADPVVSPAYTAGLEGTPHEIKIKYAADNEFADLSGDALSEALRSLILEKDALTAHDMAAEGTTPRRLRDLVGSLCDLTSGSGDRGTPVVLIQNYFKNFASED